MCWCSVSKASYGLAAALLGGGFAPVCVLQHLGALHSGGYHPWWGHTWDGDTPVMGQTSDADTPAPAITSSWTLLPWSTAAAF